MDRAQVASAVIAAWGEPADAGADEGSAETLPAPGLLEELMATSFEASLLREENRPLRFRLIVRHGDTPGLVLYVS